ncbi:MAG: response regulator [Blastocatellales bacterium]
MANKILLADDSVTVQKIITLTFSDEGVDVETVNNGDEALNKLQYLRPSLVMADVSIPGRDGYQICEYVKNHPDLSHIPVVLLVPAFEPFDAEKAKRAGADTYLTKPFQSIKALITTVKNLIDPPVVPREVEQEKAADTAPAEKTDNVVDMTTRIAPVREEQPAQPRASVAEENVRPRYVSGPLHGISEEDNVLDIDDVLAEAWEPQEVIQEPVEPPPPVETAPSAVITDEQIDRIVDRLVERLVPILTEEIVGRLASAAVEPEYHEPDERQLSFHDPDALLEIDEL